MPSGYADRSPGQRLWLAGAVTLLAVLTIGGGWLTWQGVRTAAPADVRPAGPAPTGGVAPLAGTSVAFGAPELVDGVPWGFPPSRDGAVVAALSAVAVTGQPEVVFAPDRFAQIAGVVFTEQAAVEQARQVDAARAEFETSSWAAQPASRRLYFFTPVAGRLTGWDPEVPSATVEVWAMTLVGLGDAGGAVFTTSTVDLTAEEGTWMVTGMETVQGPTPLVQEVASAPGRTRALLRDAVPSWPLPLPVPTGAGP